MEVLNKELWGNTLIDYLISVGIIVGALVLTKVIYSIILNMIRKRTEKSQKKNIEVLLRKTQTPFTLTILFVACKISLLMLNQPETSSNGISKLFNFLSAISITWLISRAISALLAGTLSKNTADNSKKLDKHLVSLLQKISVYVIWLVGFIFALHVVGVKVSALVAGLGIGSMAIALAAQDTIKNLFGGFTLFIDHPFRIGERIKIDAVDGHVTDIGMRSLRIRTLDNRIVSIPNSKVVDSTLENVTSQPSARMKVKLGLTYDTSFENMALAMELLKSLPQKIKGIESEVNATFDEYGDFSMQILLIYYIKSDADYFGTISEVNMEILRMFNENKLEFAFPTQTLYVKK